MSSLNSGDQNKEADSSTTSLEIKFCQYIMQELLPADCGIEISAEDDLLTIGHLDSLQFMRLVQYTEDEYSLKIPAQDLLIENFQTVSLLSEYVAGRLDTKEK